MKNETKKLKEAISIIKEGIKNTKTKARHRGQDWETCDKTPALLRAIRFLEELNDDL